MSNLYSDIKEVGELFRGKGYPQTLPFAFFFYCGWHWRAFQQHGFFLGLRSSIYGFAEYLVCMGLALVICIISWRRSHRKQMTTLSLTK